eukprot:1859931-Pleurochrysis_carterae.AAC.1
MKGGTAIEKGGKKSKHASECGERGRKGCRRRLARACLLLAPSLLLLCVLPPILRQLRVQLR